MRKFNVGDNLAPLQMKTSLEVTCVGPSFEHENENKKNQNKRFTYALDIDL